MPYLYIFSDFQSSGNLILYISIIINGMDKALLILDVDMSEITDTISYEEDNPLMNSTYILYYEVAR